MDKQDVLKEIDSHIEVSKLVAKELLTSISEACKLVVQTVESGNRIYLFGNGGSASDAQHIAAEFTGRFVKERKGLPAMALTTDTSALTAIGNDYGYERIFERQVEALATENDLLIGISTSGNSKNVVRALEYGKRLGCKTLGLSGNNGGIITDHCDINLIINSNITARIQEMHILLGHILCTAVDNKF